MDNLLAKGGFRVDRARALDKLMHFQLPDPSLFPIPLVRCAVAGGAARIRLGFSRGVVEAEFDGAPFSADELKDPYSCLLDERGPESRRQRELATALLTALRLNPKCLTVDSGVGNARTRLTVRSLKEDSIEPAPSEEVFTRVRVDLPFISLFSQNWRVIPVGKILQRCRGIPLELRFFDTAPVYPGRDEPALGPSWSFGKGPVRGCLRPSARPDEPSPLDLYFLGVEVGRAWHSFPGLQAEGWFNDDNFTLNASQTAAVRNERFDEALAMVNVHIEFLVKAAADAQAASLAGVSKALMAGGRPLSAWNDRLSRGAEAEKVGLFAELAGWVRTAHGEADPVPGILAEARTMAWLRGAAERVLAGKSAAKKPGLLQQTLWKAPLLLSTEGAPLSLDALLEQGGRIGYVPCSNAPFPGRAWPLQVAWTPGPSDHSLLKAVFKEEVRDVGPTLAAIIHGPGTWEQAAGLALLKPGEVLLAEKLEIPGIAGEIGFLAQPASTGRIHLYYRGLPCGFIDHPCGLRFTAAVDCADEAAVRGRLTEIEAAAVRLCDCVSGRPGRPEPRLIPHIVDFMEYAEARGEAFQDAHAWIRSAAIFRRQQANLTLPDLHQILDGGQSVYLCSLKAAPQELADRTVLVPANLVQERLRKLFAGYRFMQAWGLKNTWLIYKPSGRAAVPLTGEPDLENVIAILEESGSYHDHPEDPARDYLLRSILPFQGPGRRTRGLTETEKTMARRAHLGELLRNLPFFRTPDGGVTLPAVALLLSKGLKYAGTAGEAKRLQADLILSPSEAELIRSLYPRKAGGLVQARRRAPQGPPPPPQAPPAFPSPAPVLFRRRYCVAGLDIQVALPSRFGRPALTVALDGRPAPAQVLAAALLWVGSIWIEATGRGPKDLPSAGALQHLLGLFYREFAEVHFPKLRGQDQENGVRYLLALLVQDKKRSLAPGAWRQLMDDLCRVPLFRTVAGVPLSLESMRALKGPSGHIQYLKADGRPLPPGLGDMPLLSHPDLVSRLIGIGVSRLRPAHFGNLRVQKAPAKMVRAAAPEPPPPPRAEPPPPPPKLITKVEDTTLVVSPMTPAIVVSPTQAPIPAPLPSPVPAPTPALDPISRATRIMALVVKSGIILPEGEWFGDGPLFATIAKSGLPDQEKAAYLASIGPSAQNRRRADFTDIEEARFQQALARHLAQEDSHD